MMSVGDCDGMMPGEMSSQPFVDSPSISRDSGWLRSDVQCVAEVGGRPALKERTSEQLDRLTAF